MDPVLADPQFNRSTHVEMTHLSRSHSFGVCLGSMRFTLCSMTLFLGTTIARDLPSGRLRGRTRHQESNSRPCQISTVAKPQGRGDLSHCTRLLSPPYSSVEPAEVKIRRGASNLITDLRMIRPSRAYTVVGFGIRSKMQNATKFWLGNDGSVPFG